MAFVHTIPVEQAAGDVRAMYERTQGALGYVPNYAKVFSHRPDVMTAWSGLLAGIRGHLDARRYELVTLAAARALRSSYCMLAHGSAFRLMARPGVSRRFRFPAPRRQGDRDAATVAKVVRSAVIDAPIERVWAVLLVRHRTTDRQRNPHARSLRRTRRSG